MDANDLIIEEEEVWEILNIAMEEDTPVTITTKKNGEAYSSYLVNIYDANFPNGRVADFTPLVPLKGNRLLAKSPSLFVSFPAGKFMISSMLSFEGIIGGDRRRLIRCQFPNILRVSNRLADRQEKRFPATGERKIVGSITPRNGKATHFILNDISKGGLGVQIIVDKHTLKSGERARVEFSAPRVPIDPFTGMGIICHSKKMNENSYSHAEIEILGLEFPPLSVSQNLIINRWLDYFRKSKGKIPAWNARHSRLVKVDNSNQVIE